MEQQNSLYLTLTIQRPETPDSELRMQTETNMHPVFMVNLLEDYITQVKNTQQWQELNKNEPTTLAEAAPDSRLSLARTVEAMNPETTA